jgi:glycine/D-amino acid oxidase-like deaminating enzyme/predicted kinase
LNSYFAAEGGATFMASETAKAKSRKRKDSSAAAPPARSSVATRTRSIWRATAPTLDSAALEQNARADVCVVGAGIAGLTTAYLLAREGKSVVLLEKDKVGGSGTSHTSALLSNMMDAGYRKIESVHGEKRARLTAQSRSSAITRIDFIVAREQIHCDFERVDGYLFLGPKDSEKDLHEEFEAAQRAGVKLKELKCPPFDLKLGPCLQFRRQAQFHPLKYMAGLAAAIKRYGGRIYSRTEAKEVKGGKTAEIITKNRKKISAGAVVVTTNPPMNDWVTMHAKQSPYQSYVIGIPIPKGSIPKALYWDTGDPFHFVRVTRMRDGRADRDVLIVGCEDRKTGHAEDLENCFAHLRVWARTHFAATGEPEFRWSGQVIKNVDGLAFTGRNPGDDENVYIAAGASGMDLTHGTIAGTLLTDLILERDNAWATLYDPSRESLRAAPESATDNLDVAAEHTSWVAPGEVSTAEEVKPGTAAVIRKGFSRIAVYRDDSGKLSSAVCPHPGCVLCWNASDRSWYCPCHGSLYQSEASRSLDKLGWQGDAMPTLFLICGLPGAGKTTLAKRLERERAALRLTSDEWIAPLFDGDMERSKLDARRSLVEAVQWDVAARVLASGVDVILDWGFCLRREREEYRSRAKALGACAELRFLDVSRNDLWTRFANRDANLPPDAYHIDEAQLDLWSSRFERPTSDELGSFQDPLGSCS